MGRNQTLSSAAVRKPQGLAPAQTRPRVQLPASSSPQRRPCLRGPVVRMETVVSNKATRPRKLVCGGGGLGPFPVLPSCPLASWALPAHCPLGQWILRRLGPSLPACLIQPFPASPLGALHVAGGSPWPCRGEGRVQFWSSSTSQPTGCFPWFPDSPEVPPALCSQPSQALPCLQLHLVQPVPAPEPSWGTG